MFSCDGDILARDTGSRRTSARRDVEITRSRSNKRNRNRRRSKYWAQTVLGIILGLLLGFAVEFNVYVNRGFDNDTFCRPVPQYGSPTSPKANANLKVKEYSTKTAKSGRNDFKPNNARDSLVFVGVMTAQKYLSTRAVAVYETWGRELPGKIAFFSSESSTVPENRKDLPLVPLRTVDDSYPPQKKSFMMLQYMWENYGNQYEWFIRADDDVYMRPDKLEHFLRSIDSRRPLFIGQAGRGNQEEFGLLSLEFDENFCMGGPGIIMSRETLSRMAPHVKYCLKNLYTTHEDVELGRCVRKFADISCTWSYEMQTILYHNSSGYEAFTGNLKRKEVNRAITLHPIKQYQHMYRLHNYMRQLKIQDLQHEIILLNRDIKMVLDTLSSTEGETAKTALDKLLTKNNGVDINISDVHLTGKKPSIKKFEPKSEEEVLQWDFIQRSMYSAGNLNPRRRIEVPFKEGIEDVVREFMEMINQFSRQRGRTIEYQDLLYGYSRVDPLHGADYILDMLLKYKKYRGRKMTVPVRRHAYLQQQFTGIEIRDVTEQIYENKELTQSTGLKKMIQDSWMDLKERFPPLAQALVSSGKEASKEKIINFILPLSGRYQTFVRFMKNYEEVCLMKDKHTELVIILFRKNQENSYHETVEFVDKLQRKYPQFPMKIIPVNDDFARAMALEIGSAYCKDDDMNILFFIDVDMMFKEDTLARIRRNTIRGQQVYFPIIYSEFDPTVVYNNHSLSSSPNHFLINSDTGYWRQFGFGIASVYKMDLKKVGGFDTSIRGWGKEDVDLYEKFISSSANITIFRSVDPTLIHVFHLVDCDPNLELSQLKMCKGTRKDTYGNVNQLANCIYNNPQNFKRAINRKKKGS